MTVLAVLLPWLAAGAASLLALALARRSMRSRLALREAEASRDAAESRARSLAERAAYGLYTAAPDGRLVEVNAALVAMLGYDSDDALRASDLRAPRLPADAQQSPVVGDEAGSGWVETEWPRRDGTVLVVRVASHARRDAGGRVVAYDGVVEDAGGRRRQEEILRRGEHLASLGRMLAGAAHELNNPLAAVSGFAQLLLRSPMRADERTALETIDHEARRAATIVKDLLTFSRRGSATERRLVDLNAVVRYIAGTRRYALETSGVQLALDLVDGPLEVLGDVAQLEQVVLNLLANAQEALDADAERGVQASARAGPPRVTLRTARLDRLALLEVADNGPGIDAANLPVIWEPFFTTKGATEGTGLGLAVVHRLVNDHAGVVDVESEPGAGARFRVVLPLPTARERDGARPAPSPELARRPLDVLVADADPETADFLGRYLRTRGHAVLVATDAQQTLRLAAANGFDVIIADVALAGLDGAFVREMRNAHPATRCVFVVDAPDAQLDAEATDDFVVLARPFQIEQLRRAVEDE